MGRWVDSTNVVKGIKAISKNMNYEIEIKCHKLPDKNTWKRIKNMLL